MLVLTSLTRLATGTVGGWYVTARHAYDTCGAPTDDASEVSHKCTPCEEGVPWGVRPKAVGSASSATRRARGRRVPVERQELFVVA